MLRVLLVDDETPARRRLQQFLAGKSDITVVGEAADGLAAVAAIERLAPDLVFLDVKMPELDGFGVVRAIGVEAMPATVFVTAFDDFAVAAFDANAVDYLLKPFEQDRFQRALDRARTRIAARGATDTALQQLRGLIEGLAAPSRYADRLMVREGDARQLLRVEDIRYITAEGNYVRLHSADGSHLLRETLRKMAARLDPARFRRIHRSTLVNVDHVRKLLPWFGGDCLVIMSDGRKLALSRTCRGALPELLGGDPSSSGTEV